ncbi:MAG: hypothetical protein J6Y33_03495 [Prevotella sp.]|nr:hypothetical protein [Prevotella sp.]
MTTPKEMKERYDALYDYMAQSRDPKNMKAFGCVMTEMMDWLVDNKPDVAEEMIDKLEAVRWHQYLTPKEAERIVAGMDPKAPWSRDAWKGAMESFGLPLEDAPYYNRCALWTEMNKIYSDFGEEIAALLGRPLSPSDGDIIGACYKMALKNLKDKDGMYDIRKYFLW